MSSRYLMQVREIEITIDPAAQGANNNNNATTTGYSEVMDLNGEIRRVSIQNIELDNVSDNINVYIMDDFNNILGTQSLAAGGPNSGDFTCAVAGATRVVIEASPIQTQPHTLVAKVVIAN